MMKKSGDLLKEARLAKNLSLEEVYEGTKIRPSYIEAIESSDYSKFHSLTTIKGFLRNYATFLGLNPDNIIAMHRREQNVKSESSEKKFKFKLPKLTLSSTIFVGITVLILISGVIAFFVYQYIAVTKPPVFEILEPADLSTTTQDKITIRVLAEKGSELLINNKSITTIDSNNNFFTSVDLIEGENVINVTAINGYKKQTIKDIKVIRKKPEVVVVTPDLNVTIKSISNKVVSIKYTLDQGTQVTKSFTPGETIPLVAKQRFGIEGPANMSSLLEVNVNQNKVSLLPNILKQQITIVDNQIKITQF